MDAPRRRWLSIQRKRLTEITQQCYELYRTSPGGNIPQNSNCTATYYPSRKSSKLDEPNMQFSAEDVRTNWWAMYFWGSLYMKKQRLDDQLEPIYCSSVPIWNVDWKTSRERWTIETNGERLPGKSVLAAGHDDDDDKYKNWITIITLFIWNIV